MKTDPAVAAFMKALDHPLKKDVETVRQLILAVSPEVQEGIKWNVPSFRTTEYFATFNLRTADSVRLILHLGAKVRATAKTGVKIADPDGLLEWLAKDRAMITLGTGTALKASHAPLTALLREWIALV